MYGISVAADLVGMGVQNLRLYEARGLLKPARTEGGTRRYSTDDLERLRRIAHLLDAGVNLAGISMVLDLEAQNTQLRADRLPPGVMSAADRDGPAPQEGGHGLAATAVCRPASDAGTSAGAYPSVAERPRQRR